MCKKCSIVLTLALLAVSVLVGVGVSVAGPVDVLQDVSENNSVVVQSSGVPTVNPVVLEVMPN